MAVKKIKTVEELEKKLTTCSSCLEKKFSGKDGKRHIVVCGGTGCLSSDSQGIINKLNQIINKFSLNLLSYGELFIILEKLSKFC